MRLRPKNPQAISDPPSKSAVEPPSGTAAAEAENVKVCGPPPLAGFWVLKLQVNSVGAKPLPLTVPIPMTPRKFADWLSMCDDCKSNVKPPTVQKLGIAPELKLQGVAPTKEAGVLIAIPPKLPKSPFTAVLLQLTTSVAVPTDGESKFA